jgi:hypothetical protein
MDFYTGSAYEADLKARLVPGQKLRPVDLRQDIHMYLLMVEEFRYMCLDYKLTESEFIRNYIN